MDKDIMSTIFNQELFYGNEDKYNMHEVTGQNCFMDWVF